MTIETARRASLEFVCVFGQDGADGNIVARRVQDRSDRIEANSTLTSAVNRNRCAFTRDQLPGRVVLKLKVQDDGGNEHDLEATA